MNRQMRLALLGGVCTVAGMGWLSIPVLRQANAGCNAAVSKTEVKITLTVGSPEVGGVHYVRLNKTDNAGGSVVNAPNGTLDVSDSTPLSFPDSDLVKITITVTPVPATGGTFSGETVKLFLPKSGGTVLVKAWSDAKKTMQYTADPIVFSGVNGPTWTNELWLEGYAPGLCDATHPLVAWIIGTGTSPDDCEDSKRIAVANVNLRSTEALTSVIISEHLEESPPQGSLIGGTNETPANTIAAEDLGPGVTLPRRLVFSNPPGALKYAVPIGGVFPSPPTTMPVPSTPLLLPSSGECLYQVFKDASVFPITSNARCELQVLDTTGPSGVVLFNDAVDFIPVKVVFSKSANHKYGYDKHESMTSIQNNSGVITTSVIQPLPEYDIMCGKQNDVANTFVHVDIYGCLPNQVTFSVDDATVAKIGATPASTAQVAAPSDELKIWPQSPDKDYTMIKAQVGSPPVTVEQIEMWTYREPIPLLPYWHVTVNDVGVLASAVNVGSLTARADNVFRQAVVKVEIVDKEAVTAAYSGQEIKNDICDVYAGIDPGKEVEKIVDVLKSPAGIGYQTGPQNAILVVHVKKVRQVLKVTSLSFDSTANETTVQTAGDPTFAIQSGSVRLEGWNNSGGVPVTELRTVTSSPVGSAILYTMKIAGPALPGDFVAPQYCAIVGPAVAGLAVPDTPFFGGFIIVSDSPSATVYESLVLHEIGHTRNLGVILSSDITWNDVGPQKNLMFGATYTPPAGSPAPNELRNRPLPLYQPLSGATEQQWDRVNRVP